MYKTILVYVDTVSGAAERVLLSVDVARHFNAKLLGITAALPSPPVATITTGVVDAGILLESEREQIDEDFKSAEQQFRAVTASAGLTIEWRAVAEFPTLALANTASAADLVIIGSERRGVFGGDYRTVNPGELLLRAGRPVLIAPSGTNVLDAHNILVAWKNTREARRAVVDALPFLKRAEAVNLVEIREAREADSLQDAETFLSAHAVKVHSEWLERDSTSIEEQLTAFARRARSDLIVAGGYGHSRIRELVFGGVTRSLITDCPVATLLSH